ncbi:MAG TPA: ABC transporter permease [Burkholderiaceae bacterium]|nr:ABC transporter permease [Burkholderiaceae bacterium]
MSWTLPTVRALDRKLLRDLARMWSQALTIALVVASGIGGFVASLSAVESLAAARDRFYAQGRFAQLFAVVKRAPDSLQQRLLEVPGVADVQGTVERTVRVEIEGRSDPILGQLIGIDRKQPRRMNQVVVSSGRALDSDDAPRGDGNIEALVSEGFARANHLSPGARLSALINGKQRTLVMVGSALSPEYVFAGLFGMPDVRGFGVFWVDQEALAAAYDMKDALDHLSIRLAPWATERAVAEQVRPLLVPYGGREAYGRADQTSNAMLDNEIKEQRVLGTVLPVIFLAVAAFLLNVVVSRLVATQREQIATLKAVGYDNRRIAAHYLKLVLLIVAAGLALGIALGDWLGGWLTELYAEFFHFPSFEHGLPAWLVVTSILVTVGTAVAGTLNAIVASVRLPPAEAMRPPAPDHYRRTLLERLGITGMPPALRMIVRNLERRPLRSGLAVLGIATAVAIVVLGNFVRDAIDIIVDTQFNLVLRGDVTMWTVEATDDAARREVARLPGARAVESVRFVPVTFVYGHRRERGMIRGYEGRARLYRVIDGERQEVLLEGRGLVMNDRLAAKLGLRAGDVVQVEVIEGRGQTLELPLAAVVPEMMGLNAYMDRRELNRLLGDGDVSTGFIVATWRHRETDVLDASKQLPRIAGAWSKATMLRNMEEISARNVRIMATIMTAFATVIAVGVVYNNARIALAERAWELASLRVLGFTRGEVSTLLLGELAISIALALPLGMVLGFGLTHLVVELLRSDQFNFPVVVSASTYAWAALCVVAAGVASAMVVRRRIDRLDMVSALKARD